MKAHVSNAKKEELAKLIEMIRGYKVIGIIDLNNYPSDKLQTLKGKFRDKVDVKISKKSLMKMAFENNEKDKAGIIKLAECLDYGIPALILSNEDPFKLSKQFARSKSMTVAKAGQVSPGDITIQAGPTSFAPGPVIGELSSAGLKTAVESGKIVIKEDKLFVKKGEIIDSKKADVMSKLGIEPIEVKVKIIAMFEDGKVYHSNVLEIDEEEYINQLKEAGQDAFNLAFNIGYISKETISLLLSKAYIEALALSEKTNINGG